VLRDHPNTVISIVGDHGLGSYCAGSYYLRFVEGELHKPDCPPGYGDHFRTEAGKLEYKLPVLQLVIPKPLLREADNFRRALQLNTKR